MRRLFALLVLASLVGCTPAGPKEIQVAVTDMGFEPKEVTIAKGHLAEVKAKVTEIRARTCIITFSLLGKDHQQAMPYAQLKPG